MALTTIIVIRRSTPGKVWAYHSADQSETVSEAYPADTFRAFRIASDTGFQPGDPVDTTTAEELTLSPQE
jgi:hypothetical protein